MLPDYFRQKMIDDCIELAKEDIGIREISPNRGWHDNDYEDFMIRVLKYHKGDPWCVYAAARHWLRTLSKYDGYRVADILEIFSPLAQGFYNRCKTSIKFNTKTDNPQPSDIVIFEKWVNNKVTYMGHAALVIEPFKDRLITIDGNVNDGKTNDGEVVSIKEWEWRIAKPGNKKKHGLYVKGFIEMPMV